MSFEVLTFIILNDLLYGMFLFMLSSGLTLIFGMMGVLNFAHASFFMLGAYIAYQINSMTNFLNVHKDKFFEVPNYKFINEIIKVDDLDYYHSNSVARASKTMNECKNLSSKIKKTGTDG